MRSKFVFFTLITITLLLFGCNDNHAAIDYSDKENIGTLSDSLKEHMCKQDSLSRELVLKIDTLTQKLNMANDEIETLRSIVDKKSPNMLWDVLPLLFSFLALIIAFVVGWFTRHDIPSDKLGSILNKHLKDKGLLELKENVQMLMNGQKQQKYNYNPENNKFDFIENKISLFEKRIDEQERILKSLSNPIIKKSDTSYSTTHLYAKSTDRQYFTETVPYKEETCAFEIELKSASATKGIFDIASFGQITQMNGLEHFIFCTGNCKMEEAKSYKTSRKGECEKQSNGLWKVTSKLKIEIYK